jgi:hypothetical protein
MVQKTKAAHVDYTKRRCMDMTLRGDMAVLCAYWKAMDLCASALAQCKLPHRVRKKSGE